MSQHVVILECAGPDSVTGVLRIGDTVTHRRKAAIRRGRGKE